MLVALGMPTTGHELPLMLLRAAPDVVALLAERVGVLVHGALVETSASFAELMPAAYAADLVLVADEAVIVRELQTARDDVKRMRWPLYCASAHALHEKATWLVVLTLDARVARWAAQPIQSFHSGAFAPLVVGPSTIPRVSDLELARARPELAVLSALAHAGEDDGLDVTMAGLVASAAVERAARTVASSIWTL